MLKFLILIHVTLLIHTLFQENILDTHTFLHDTNWFLQQVKLDPLDIRQPLNATSDAISNSKFLLSNLLSRQLGVDLTDLLIVQCMVLLIVGKDRKFEGLLLKFLSLDVSQLVEISTQNSQFHLTLTELSL